VCTGEGGGPPTSGLPGVLGVAGGPHGALSAQGLAAHPLPPGAVSRGHRGSPSPGVGLLPGEGDSSPRTGRWPGQARRWACGWAWCRALPGHGELEPGPAAAPLGQGLRPRWAEMGSWAVGRWGETWGAGQGQTGLWMPAGPWQPKQMPTQSGI